MKIEHDVKLDFSDVLIRPKRTILSSRSEVDLEREFKFPHSPFKWKGIPIIAANMDTTGTMEVMKSMSQHKLLTCLHKFYTLENYRILSDEEQYWSIISTGIGKYDFKKLLSILNMREQRNSDLINIVCVDVANGYMQDIVVFCQKLRWKY